MLDNIGLPYSSINMTYSNSGTIGTADSEILVQLKQKRGKPTSAYVAELRRRLPRRVSRCTVLFPAGGHRYANLEFRDAGANRHSNPGPGSGGQLRGWPEAGKRNSPHPGGCRRARAAGIRRADLAHGYRSHSCAIRGAAGADIAQNVLVSLSSSFQTSPSFWLDPKNGVSYNVSVQTPQYRIDSLQALENIPSLPTEGAAPQIVGNLVSTSTVARPALHIPLQHPAP